MKRYSQRQLPLLNTEIQITPLLDLLLLLLLTVVVLVPALRLESRAADEPESPPARTVDLIVAPDLKLSLAGEPITDRELIPALKLRMAVAPETGVVVRIPANLQASALLQIMDALRSAEVKHTAVLNDRPSKSP